MTTADILDKAADLIEPEGAWTQGYGARDSKGMGCGTTDPQAVCWCVVGAIGKVTGDWVSLEALDARQALADFVGYPTAAHWNDDPSRTQSEVVAKLREASTQARRGG